MIDIQQLKCENCGAPLKEDLTCPYCGARYERKGAGINTCYVQMIPAKVHPLRAQVMIPDEQIMCLGEEETAEYAINTLVSALSKEIGRHMKVTTGYAPGRSPFEACQIIRGEVRIVDPDFRF